MSKDPRIRTMLVCTTFNQKCNDERFTPNPDRFKCSVFKKANKMCVEELMAALGRLEHPTRGLETGLYPLSYRAVYR